MYSLRIENLTVALPGGQTLVNESLRQAGLADMEHRDPATLSGAQRARVSLVTWDSAASLPVLLVTHDASDIHAGARILEIGSATASVCATARLSRAGDAG